MDFVDWRLLLLLGVFVTGWMIARVDMEQVVSKARAVPDKIMEGIGHLLRGERDMAANMFVESGQPLSPENAELHFSAGELYRLQGNYENAIRVHKGLIACAELDDRARARARYELGLDYQKGGFLDLAQDCFKELEGTEHAEAALRHLFNVHLYSKAWKSAIEDEERFAKEDINSELRRHVIAQLYCEWAAVEGEIEREKLLDQALEKNPNCGRALMMRAEAALGKDDNSAALAAIENLRNKPEFIPVAASLIMRVTLAVGEADRGEAQLLAAFRDNPTPIMFEKVYEALAQAKGHGAMVNFVKEAMKDIKHPVVVVKWLEVEIAKAEGQRRDELDAMLLSMGNSRPGFDCSKCAFHASNHYWQCPVCLSWETMLPGKKTEIGSA